MYTQQDRKRNVIVFGILGIIAFSVAPALPEGLFPISAGLYLLAAFFGGFALYELYLYNRQARIEHARKEAEIRTWTVPVRMAEAMSKCGPEQLALMQNYMPLGEIVAGQFGEVTWTINLGKDPKTNLDIRIPLEFAQDYFDKCTAFHTAPIGHWSEGPGRFMAHQFTDWFVNVGYAKQFNGGNVAAAWISVETYRRACEWVSKFGVIVRISPENLNGQEGF